VKVEIFPAFQCATHIGFNESIQLFLVPLPLSVILQCPHLVEIQNTTVFWISSKCGVSFLNHVG